MITIQKHAIPFGDREFQLTLQAGALFLSMQTQGNTPIAWFLVDTEAPVDPVVFAVRYTGEDCTSLNDESWKYLGTTLVDGGQLVLHLFTHSPQTAVIAANAIEEGGDAASS